MLHHISPLNETVGAPVEIHQPPNQITQFDKSTFQQRLHKYFFC